MVNKLKKLSFYTALLIILGGMGIFLFMEDYQKENMSKFINQTLSK